MSTQRHPVSPHPIETLPTWVKSGEIAIPEIQRPFADLLAQCNGDKNKHGGIKSLAEPKANLRAHCRPLSLLDGEISNYDAYLAERRALMAQKIRDWFEAL